MCQDTEASDDGFVALSRSRTLEHLWGRRCYNLRRRGFVALAEIPTLAYLSVSCRNVDDEGPDLRKYFASYNRVTDRTPEMLATIPSPEEITFDSCAGLTNAGIAALARLPRLRTLGVSGMRSVTADIVRAFGPGVEVRHGR